jgi:hypothetical protein
MKTSASNSKKIRANFHYQVPALGLWANSNALGSHWSGAYEHYEIELTMPQERSSFGAEILDPHGALTGAQSTRGNTSAVGIRIFQVSVSSNADIEAATYAAIADANKKAHSIFQELLTVADRFVHEFLQHLRADYGQHLLGSSSETPRLVLHSDLIDHTGQRLPFTSGRKLTFVVQDLDKAISLDQLIAAAVAASSKHPISLPEELLSDAKYLAWGRATPDRRYSTVLAAIACEAKVKHTLLSKADSRQRDLVELVLNNPRDVTIAAVNHLDKTMTSVCGRSLRTENAELWKDTNNLFTDRNRIAHGKSPQPKDSELQNHTRTAVSVFQWLDTI